VARAQTQPTVSGVAETYWLADNNVRGAYVALTWAEIKARISDHWSATWSASDYGSISAYDESYVRYETDMGSIRAGRLRTSFGFSDWSEYYYTGINHIPLVRQVNLVDETRLNRDDSGAEATANLGPLQLQAALIDTSITKAQVGPDSLDHATTTAQYGFGSLILGVNALTKTDFAQKVYGGNFRYTIPHWLFKGEYFEGIGPGNGSGSYVDATYRIPFLVRSELCARAEQVRAPGSYEQAQLETIGFRYIFNKNLTANLNYGWGNNLEYGEYGQYAESTGSLGPVGWTARVMFQVQF
jgi:hypothetical protein